MGRLGFLLLRLIWKIVERMVNYLEVTPQQLTVSSGAFVRRTTMTPLARVIDMSLQSSLLGEILGYGHLIIMVAGPSPDQRVFNCVPHVNELYLELSSWML